MSAGNNTDLIAVYMAYILIGISLPTGLSLMFRVAPYGRHGASTWVPLNDLRVKFASLTWFIQEAPSLFVPILVWWSSSKVTFASHLLLGLFLLHYFHRTFIYSYLIRSDNYGPVLIPFLGFSFCAYNGYMQSTYLLGTKYPDNWIYSWKCIVGSVLFFCGMSVNIHSDHILRTLRRRGGKEYKIPKSGMFEYVSGANYLGEIIEWLGFAIACWSLPALAFVISTACNLAPRALHHHSWYHEKFKEYPRERKALIPFIL